MLEAKSNDKSCALRTEGNAFYTQRKFHDALVKYNESLCCAESDSENVGLAYANRSAVYSEMKLFEKCLRNIELARQNHYPEKNLEILVKREEKCREMMKNRKNENVPNPWNFFKLSYPANKKISFIVDCLKVESSEKYGRYITTNRTLKVGDVLVVETPLCELLLGKSNFVEIPEANIYQRCSYCLKDNAMDLQPCSSCCRAMFCSIECSEKSFKRYHRYECPIMNPLMTSGSVHMALRLFFIALSAFDGSIEDLKVFMKENENQKLTVLDCDGKLDDFNNDKKMLLALLTLTYSSKQFSLQQHEDVLKSHPSISSICDEHRDFIKAFLLRMCQTSDLNFHGVFSGSMKKHETTIFSNLQQSIGTGTFLFTSLINHSCANNILRTCVEGKIVVVVCRPIPSGGQLFDCYKSNFVKQQKSERQARLMKEFGFKCDCDACDGNFPTPPALKVKDAKLLKFATKTDEEILNLPIGRSIKKYRDICDILDKNHQTYPCIELCMLQKCIATFLLSQAQPSILFP